MKNIMKRMIGLTIVISLVIVTVSADQNRIDVKQPIIKLKTSKDTVDKTDGIIEINVENTWKSGLNVDLLATSPDDIYFISEIFHNGEKGISGGNFVVPPGQKRTVNIYIRSDKTGKYPVKISGEYYTEASSEENLASNKIDFTQIVNVKEKSPKVPGAKPISESLGIVVEAIKTTASKFIGVLFQ